MVNFLVEHLQINTWKGVQVIEINVQKTTFTSMLDSSQTVGFGAHGVTQRQIDYQAIQDVSKFKTKTILGQPISGHETILSVLLLVLMRNSLNGM